MSFRKSHIKNKIHRIKPKKSIFTRLWFWIAVLIFFIMCAGIYFCIFYSGIQVREILISGNVKAGTYDLQNFVANSVNKKIFGLGSLQVSSKSIFLVNEKKLDEKILNNFSVIDEIKFKKNFPQTISVDIKEKKPVAVFCQNATSQECFFVDDKGVIFENASNYQNMFIVRQMLENKVAKLGDNVVNKNVVDVILKIQKNLKDNFQIEIKEATIATFLRLNVKTSEGWQVYFNIGEGYDINMQITKLNALLKGEISPEAQKGLEYIDLRFKDRAYYK